jgi:hypothetical protein
MSVLFCFRLTIYLYSILHKAGEGMKVLYILLLALTMFSCGYNVRKDYMFPNEQVINLSYDEVWQAVVDEFSAKYTIKVVDKASGIIQTDEFKPDTYLWNLTYSPHSYQLTAGDSYYASQMDYTCSLTKLYENQTKIRVVAHYYSKHQSETDDWTPVTSNGYNEYNLLNTLVTKMHQPIYGYGFSCKKGTYCFDVSYVIPDSPADKAGIEKGDVFESINDTKLNESADNYVAYLLADTNSDHCTLKVYKNYKPRIVELTKADY